MQCISDSGFGYALGKLIRSSSILIRPSPLRKNASKEAERRPSVETNLRVVNLELEADTVEQQRTRQRQKWRGGMLPTETAARRASSPMQATLHM